MHKYYYQPVLLTYNHVSLIIQINVIVEKHASRIIPRASCYYVLRKFQFSADLRRFIYVQ
jgi:hypothetical protein